MSKTLSGPIQKPFSGNSPKQIIIMLHGVGADGDNLIALANFLAKDFPDALFIAPNGCEKYAEAGSGYQWFSLWDRSQKQLLAGVKAASEKVSKFIDEMVDEYGLDYSDVILIGFSQGAMTAIQTGLTIDDKIAGVVSFSGGLINHEIVDEDIKNKPPLCLIHGEEDPVVPVQASLNAYDILDKLDVDIEMHTIPSLQHSIDMRCIEVAKRFIVKLL